MIGEELYTCMRIYDDVYVRVHVCVYRFMFMYMCMYVRGGAIHMYVYICLCLCTCTCMCVYGYMHTREETWFHLRSNGTFVSTLNHTFSVRREETQESLLFEACHLSFSIRIVYLSI